MRKDKLYPCAHGPFCMGRVKTPKGKCKLHFDTLKHLSELAKQETEIASRSVANLLPENATYFVLVDGDYRDHDGDWQVILDCADEACVMLQSSQTLQIVEVLGSAKGYKSAKKMIQKYRNA